MGGLPTVPVPRPPRLPRKLARTVNSYMEECGQLKAQRLPSSREFSGAIAAAGHAGARVSIASGGEYGPFSHRAYSVEAGGGGDLYSIQHGAGVCLFSGERGGFFGRVMRIVERPRPGVVAPFTESSTIRGILEDFEDAAGAPLRHKKSVRKTAGPMPKTTAEWDRPAKNRRYKTVGEAFADAGESRAAIDSLRAFAGENGGLDVTVSRRGLVTVHGGDVGRIYDSILRPIIDSGMDRRNRFLHRSRSERPDKEPMPLLIRYERGVFADEEGRAWFCGLFDRYPHCNYTIVHAGSRHVYISIVDRTDNSSVAVRSVGGSALAVIPQIRTSEASLLRLTAFLASEFCEGAIGEYGQ